MQPTDLYRQIPIDFLPYSFIQKISEFEPNLSFIGSTYYEDYTVYEHLIKPKILFGFKVTKVELYFSDGNLIGVSTFLNESTARIGDLKDCLVAYFNENTSVVRNDILQSVGNLIYTWEDNTLCVGILSNTADEKLFIHIIIKEFSLLW